jgi:hypothetical protein
MIMKIFSVFLIVFLMIGMFSVIVASQEVEEVEIVSPGVSVGFFSGIENSWDKMSLAFTFNRERKIQKAIDIAEERLAEIEKAMEENESSERLLRAQERHMEFLDKAEELLADIEDDGDNETSELLLRKLTRIQNKFEEHREKIDAIHARILERHRKRNASIEQIDHLEKVFSMIYNKSLEAEKRVLQRRVNMKIRYKAIRNMTDEELEEKLGEIENDEGLIEARKRRLDRERDRLFRINQTRFYISQRIRERLNQNGNLTDEQKVLMQSRLERLEANNQLRAKGDVQIEQSPQKLQRAQDLLSKADK